MAYIHKVLVALDQFANTVTGGEDDDTISSRSARAEKAGLLWGRAMCKFLSLFNKDHCTKALAGDARRASAELDRLRSGPNG